MVAHATPARRVDENVVRGDGPKVLNADGRMWFRDELTPRPAGHKFAQCNNPTHCSRLTRIGCVTCGRASGSPPDRLPGKPLRCYSGVDYPPRGVACQSAGSSLPISYMDRAGVLRLYEAGRTYHRLPRAIAHAATKRELVAKQRPAEWEPPNMVSASKGANRG